MNETNTNSLEPKKGLPLWAKIGCGCGCGCLGFVVLLMLLAGLGIYQFGEYIIGPNVDGRILQTAENDPHAAEVEAAVKASFVQVCKQYGRDLRGFTITDAQAYPSATDGTRYFVYVTLVDEDDHRENDVDRDDIYKITVDAKYNPDTKQVTYGLGFWTKLALFLIED